MERFVPHVSCIMGTYKHNDTV